MNRNFRFFQVFIKKTAIVLTWYERCTKSMGIITLALIVANIQDPTNVEPVLWVKFCATAMGLGTAVGGWKIIKTVAETL